MSRSDTMASARLDWLSPLGRQVIAWVADLGAITSLGFAAWRSALFPRGAAPSLPATVHRQLRWLLAAGCPFVALAHVGMGSFLAMQAYFGATFTEGTGAVVGIGLLRNVSPLLSGFVVAGLMAVKTVYEFRMTPAVDLDRDPSWVPDRDVRQGRIEDERLAPEPARLALPRILAAMIAMPVLSTWGMLIGLLVGWQVSGSLLGVSGTVYFHRFLEMIWQRDVIGLFTKAPLFGLIAALFACREGLREPIEGDPNRADVPRAMFRAACWSMLVILGLNLSWFITMYIFGPPFGPTLLEPPRPS